jgi:exosortase/archaeosortase family protein
MGVIGLAAPGAYYSPFVHDYLNYPVALRNSLLLGARGFVGLLGYTAYLHDAFFISMPQGRGVRMVYSCLGIGVFSFWVAFVYANKGSLKKKLAWMAAGMLLVWLINVARIGLLLLAVNGKWTMPLNMNHHTLFNIAAYTAIFLLIYLYHRSGKLTLKAGNA